ncbi:tRNA uridine-5-carboxymethylaminomethyl(34) synthesis GTPase MnmE [Candidatus Nardonella dryophthoridicola]|uniref:tRNA modification GTPase MnmE n=1 Tax=endosymbiont of Rhynchophorus ferrugineus TaxID=1972133 RepID=A0A2Z5T435_9GAMM|nr:tRNA uridine-5-carboxymethylaminomethyl(34) synthesis GTPase MnmE [Candidatus Nardonella dryophthoridicola]BBA85157.1 tRNA modification GTPase MnmE [endosymbiont of Rhynchophorus ferrugineus]
MEYINDTIIAISTPISKSAIGIIRISGYNIIKIINFFFKKKKIKERYAEFVNFIDPNNNEIIDNGILIYFKKPKSFTGEDILEFQCHGNPIIMNYIIDLIVKFKYARIALNGEFTRRAFMNNKLNLHQAESILNIIDSDNIDTVKLAIKSLNGTFTNKINIILNNLIELKILVESYISFENEDNNIIIENINNKFLEIVDKYNKIINECLNSLNINNINTISLIGKTNVGKSTIFNKLINKNRSIVTNISGTTRDSIIDFFSIKNNLIKIIDTAGIRKTKNIIENIGIKKTKENIKKSNILLFIVDNKLNTSNKKEFYNNLKIYINNINLYKFIIKNIKNIIFIKNKSDISNNIIGIEKINNDIYIINISAKNNLGLNILTDEIYKKLFIYKKDVNTDFLISKRHLNIIEKSFNNIKKYNNLLECYDYSILYEDINYSINDLINILGKNISNNDLLDSIFSKFCIGK